MIPDARTAASRRHPRASLERELGRLQLGSAREADEFVEAAEYVLARDPELGLRIADDSLFGLCL